MARTVGTEGTTRRGTATPVHRPQRPAGSTHSSTRGLRPPEQLERPAGFPSSAQRHPGKFPKVPGRRRGTRGFPAAPRHVIVCLVLEKPPGDLERSSVHHPHRWFSEAEVAMTPESPSCGREDFRLPGAQVLRQQLQEHRLPPTAPTALGAVQGPLCNLRSPGPHSSLRKHSLKRAELELARVPGWSDLNH